MRVTRVLQAAILETEIISHSYPISFLTRTQRAPAMERGMVTSGDRDRVLGVTEGKGKYNKLFSPGNAQKNQLNPSKKSANS